MSVRKESYEQRNGKIFKFDFKYIYFFLSKRTEHYQKIN